MRNILEGYRLFAIDPKKSRSKDFYKNMLEYRSHVMKKFAKAIKKPSEFRCLLCGNAKGEEFLALGKYKLYECARCALVSPNIDFALADEHELYGDHANSKDVVREIVETYDYRKRVHAPERLAYLLEKTGLKKKDLNVLDVGCGPGYFLSYLKDQKIKNKGLELTEFLVDICRKRGLNVEGTMLGAEKPSTYNALTLFDVLEHITDPISFFTDTNRALKKGGYVLAYVPHIHSLGYALMGSRHNTLAPFQHTAFFDPKSLAYLAKKTGFVVDSVEYFGLDIMDYFCMKQYDDNFDYLDKLAEFIPLMQAVVDKQNISNHMRIIFKKVSNV
jgi:SAM-dependent methyltransferase